MVSDGVSNVGVVTMRKMPKLVKLQSTASKTVEMKHNQHVDQSGFESFYYLSIPILHITWYGKRKNVKSYKSYSLFICMKA